MFWPLVLTCGMLVASGSSDYVYRWTDAKGTVRITNDLSRVPEDKKPGAKPMRVFTIESVEKTKTAGDAKLLQSPAPVPFSEMGTAIVTSSLVNGPVRRDVIIDTGSEITVITTKLAGTLGCEIKNARVGRFKTPAGSVTAPVVQLELVRIGPAVVKNVSAVVIDFKERGPVSAIIGMNFLSRFVFEIDYSSKKITFQLSR